MINYFYEKNIDGESIVSTPGSTSLVVPKSGEVRGAIEYNDKAYFVIGNTFYEVNSAGTATSRGTLNTSTGRVSMAHNGLRNSANQQIMIVDGSDGWIYDNSASTLTVISDADFTDSTSVVFIDGYFIFAQKDSDRFWLTSSYDGTTIAATDFETAEGDPDDIQALIADQRELFVFGKRTLEVWYNSGDTNNTFQRFQGGFKQTGCVAKFSPARVDNNIYWLSRDERGHGQVVKMGEGYSPQVISTPSIAYQFSTYSTIEDAFAYAYQHEGHEFYVITFPTAKKTWVYDASTQQWHERGHTIDGTFPNRERYNCHVFAFGKHLFGDYINGTIYKLDATVGTIDGTRIPRERTTQTVGEEEKRIRISSLQLDMQEGIGDPNVSTDTSMWMSWSKDGGHTFSDEISRTAGEAGQYALRLMWRRLGHARNWTFKLRTWTPKPHVLKGLYARLHGDR
jgi:outer membrane lipoprotein-sorting protein